MNDVSCRYEERTVRTLHQELWMLRFSCHPGRVDVTPAQGEELSTAGPSSRSQGEIEYGGQGRERLNSRVVPAVPSVAASRPAHLWVGCVIGVMLLQYPGPPLTPAQAKRRADAANSANRQRLAIDRHPPCANRHRTGRRWPSSGHPPRCHRGRGLKMALTIDLRDCGRWLATSCIPTSGEPLVQESSDRGVP